MITPEELIASGQFSWCHPTSKGDLLLDYPMLREQQVFMDLDSPRKLLFVWFYACKASRARELPDDKERIRYALMCAWGTKWPKEVNTFIDGRWGKEVQDAIAVMRDIEPGPYIMRRVMCARDIDRVRRMLAEEPMENLPPDEKLKFFKAVQGGYELLDQLLAKVQEGSSGVVKKTEEMVRVPGQIMELLHQAKSGS